MTALIIHPGALGDVITAFPAFIHLKQRFQNIHIICQHQIGKIVCSLGLAQQTYPIESARFAALFSDESSDILSFSETHEKNTNFFNPYEHVQLFSFSKTLCQSISQQTHVPVNQIDPRPHPDEKFQVSRYLLNKLNEIMFLPKDFPKEVYEDKRNPAYTRGKVLIHPGSGSRRKNWPLDRFICLYESLQAQDLSTAFILGPAEHDLIKNIGNSFHLNSPESVDDLLSVLKSSEALIGNDSGVAHLAGYIGLSTTVIFGPSDPKRWLPTGRQVNSVTADEIACTPCFEYQSIPDCGYECLMSIDPEKVLKIWRRTNGYGSNSTEYFT